MDCHLFKIICLGDTRTGKTHFLESMHRLMYCKRNNRPFVPLETIAETIGMQFYHKLFHHEDHRMKIHFWDLSGQNRFREIVQTYFSLGDMVLYFFNVSDMDSFYSVKDWMNKVHKSIREETPKHRGHTFRPISILIGNRKNNRIGKAFADYFPSRKACMSFCNKYRLKYIEYDGSMKSIEYICSHICRDLISYMSYIYKFKYRENQIQEEVNPCRFVFRKNTLSTVDTEISNQTHKTNQTNIPILNGESDIDTDRDDDGHDEINEKNECYIDIDSSMSYQSNLSFSEDHLLCVDDTIIYDKSTPRKNIEKKVNTNETNQFNKQKEQTLSSFPIHPSMNNSYSWNSSSSSNYTSRHYLQVLNSEEDEESKSYVYGSNRALPGLFWCC